MRQCLIGLVSVLLGGAGAAQAQPAMSAHPSAQGRVSEMSSRGRVELRCANGRGSIYVGRQRIGDAPGDCENGSVVRGGVRASRTFPSGEQVFLIMGPGSHMTNAGAALYVRRGQTPRLVQIDYAVETGRILAADRFTFVATGMQNANCRAATWVTEYRVDWARQRIASEREISRNDGCGGN